MECYVYGSSSIFATHDGGQRIARIVLEFRSSAAGIVDLRTETVYVSSRCPLVVSSCTRAALSAIASPPSLPPTPLLAGDSHTRTYEQTLTFADLIATP